MSEVGLNTISFAGRAAASSQFKALYAEGMDTALEWATRVPISDKGSVEVRPRLQM